VNYDVVILGSGLTGSVLATILAKQGLDVLVLDSAVHPRFAIGESTIPQTSQLFSLLAKQWKVPELHYFGLDSPQAILDNVSSSCGVKKTLSFLYHDFTEGHRAEWAHIFGNVWRTENHFFRQDVDQFLVELARQYGAEVSEGTEVSDFGLQKSHIDLSLSSGHSVKSQYLVDASGYRSPVSRELGLRPTPAPLRTHSRSLFTHFKGVTPFQPNPFHACHSEGTLHHIFPGGWIWIIPFNNQSGSTNELVSVGLQLDTRLHPPNGVSADEEFQQVLSRLPACQHQFAAASRVRPWTRTGRIQYSSTRTTGHRWCLLGQSAGFVDPLFSRGMISALEQIHTLAPHLIECCRNRDFGGNPTKLQVVQKRALDFTDRLVHNSYLSWSSFGLWNAWFRVWALGVICIEANLGSRLLMGPYCKVAPTEEPLCSPFEDQGYANFFDRAEQAMNDYQSGSLTSDETTERLFHYLASHKPVFRLKSGSQEAHFGLTSPSTREILLGETSCHQRWAQRLPDPHLTQT
jgi:FADH2 O2-dependent halogenase